MENNILKCPSCNYLLEDDDLFCPHCGAKIKDETASNFNKPNSKNRKKSIIVVVLVLLVLALGGGILLVSNKINKLANSLTNAYNNQVISQEELTKKISDEEIPGFLTKIVFNKIEINFNTNALKEIEQLGLSDRIIDKESLKNELARKGYSSESIDYAISNADISNKIISVIEDPNSGYQYESKESIQSKLNSLGYTKEEVDNVINGINWSTQVFNNIDVERYLLEKEAVFNDLINLGFSEEDINEAFIMLDDCINYAKEDHSSEKEIVNNIYNRIGREFNPDVGYTYPATVIVDMYYPEHDFRDNAFNRAKQLIGSSDYTPSELKGKLQSYGFADYEINYAIDRSQPAFVNSVQNRALNIMKELQTPSRDIVWDKLASEGYADSPITSLDWEQLLIDYFYWSKEKYQYSDDEAFRDIFDRFSTSGDSYSILMSVKERLGLNTYVPDH